MAIYNGQSNSGGRRAGVASCTIDGEAVDVAGDLIYDATKVRREELVGQSGPQGYSEQRKNGYIGLNIRDDGNMSQQAFMDLTSVSIVAVLANGKVVSGDNMWCMECSEVRTAEGTFSVRFAGRNVEEY